MPISPGLAFSFEAMQKPASASQSGSAIPHPELVSSSIHDSALSLF
jgi:hypothetical protein